MRIKIYVLPEYKESFWSVQSLKAVAAETLRKRYTAEYIEAASVTEIDFDKVFAKGEKRVLLYIGFSIYRSPGDLRYLAEHGIHTLLLNYESNNFTGSCSRVLLNYRDAIEKCQVKIISLTLHAILIWFHLHQLQRRTFRVFR